jgi:hypothetical protein
MMEITTSSSMSVNPRVAERLTAHMAERLLGRIFLGSNGATALVGIVCSWDSFYRATPRKPKSRRLMEDRVGGFHEAAGS